ncbi:MAG: hypothetical protein ABSF90_16330 [Syntrophobacteraceae bacterium]|jgi:pullulanase/glycogen debranching enzyme
MMKTPKCELHDYIPEISERTDVRLGFPLPLETREMGEGVNFSIFSRNASRVRLELFDHPEDAAPSPWDFASSILHTDYRSTSAKLASLEFKNDEGVIHETG